MLQNSVALNNEEEDSQVYVYMCVYMHVCVRVYMCMSVCMCVLLCHVCVCVCIHVYSGTHIHFVGVGGKEMDNTTKIK